MNQKWAYYLLFAAIVATAAFFLVKTDKDIAGPTLKTAGPTLASPSAVADLNAPLATDVPPPWANSGSTAAHKNTAGDSTPTSGSHQTTSATGVTGASRTKPNLAELEKMQVELLAAVQSGKPDVKKLSEVLHRLKQTQGANVGGVNIDALINNLEKSQQLQDLSMEMQKETQKVGGPDQKKMQDNIERLKKLQAQMRTDVAVPPTGTAAPTR